MIIPDLQKYAHWPGVDFQQKFKGHPCYDPRKVSGWAGPTRILMMAAPARGVPPGGLTPSNLGDAPSVGSAGALQAACVAAPSSGRQRGARWGVHLRPGRSQLCPKPALYMPRHTAYTYSPVR
jgi:hypothetical protein